MQVALLGQLLGQAGLAEVECATIDRFQGRDKECILISLVKSNPAGFAGALLSDWRRVNVALTRAKRKLVLVGCAATVSEVPLFEQLLDFVQTQGWLLSLQ